MTVEYFKGIDFAAVVERARELPFTSPPPVPTPAPVRRARVRLRAEARELGSAVDLAAHTGLDRSTLSRLLRGAIAPGPHIIGGLLAAFPDRHFEDLFEIAYEEAA